MIFATCHLLHLVFSLIILFTSLKTFLGLLFPFCFHSYHRSPAHCCRIPDPAGHLPVALPVSSCSVSTTALCPFFPWPRTWIANLMPIITTAYKPCPLKNSNLVFRVLPVSSQHGNTVSVPKVMLVINYAGSAPSDPVVNVALSCPATLSVTAWIRVLHQHLFPEWLFTPFLRPLVFYISSVLCIQFKKIILAKCCP